MYVSWCLSRFSDWICFHFQWQQRYCVEKSVKARRDDDRVIMASYYFCIKVPPLAPAESITEVVHIPFQLKIQSQDINARSSFRNLKTKNARGYI
jgi:hypothetical protein